ncbi:hypothetical protein Tco_0216204 [Tanacetum coccineum]
MSKAKERCMAYFPSLHSYLQVISKDDLKGTRIEHVFKWAFMSLFGKDADTFTSTMLLNVDQLQKQLDKDEFQEDESMAAFWVINKQFQQFIDSKFTLDYDSQMIDKYFVEYTGIEVQYFRDTLLQHLEVQADSSRSGNDTDADDADIRPIYDEEPMAEVQLTAEYNIFAIGQQHTEQPEIIVEGRVDQYPETCQVKSPMLDSSPDNQTTEYSKQSLEPQMSKQRFASQVDVNNNLSKPVTQHYLHKKTESAFAKPDHMIASISSRNSSKNMPRFSSNDMVHNHYLDEARKKTQEIDRNSKSSVMPTARFQSTADDSKLKPRNNNQTPRSLPVSKSSCVTITDVPNADHSKSSSSFSDSKNFVCSTCHKCVFNANHDACITKLLKEVNSRAKIQSHKTRNSNKPKTSPRSDLRWKTTGRIFKSVGLRWIPIGKLFDSCTSKFDSKLTHGLNVDILNIHECKQTLDVSAGTSINVQKEQSLDLSAELESLFGHLFDEYLNGENQVVSKSSAVTTTDASDKRQQQLDLTSSTSTLATTVTANGNFDL